MAKDGGPSAPASSVDRSRPAAHARAALGPLTVFAAVFCLVAVLMSLALRAAAPMPDMQVLSPKLSAYRAEASSYDTVFIGTSRTLYHIAPKAVEAGAAAAGCPGWSVFNFGVFGLTGAEQDWLIDKVLAAGGPALARIVLEDPLPQPRRLADAISARGRYFHGPNQYGATLASIASYPENLPKRLFRTGVAAAAVLYDLSGVGRAPDLFPGAGAADPAVFDFRESGFEALDELDVPDILARHKDFMARPEAFDAALALYGGSSPNVRARAGYLLAKARRLADQGVEASVYVSPDPLELDRTPLVGALIAASATDVPVLNFNQPDRYGDLFERELWHDFSHLGREGAERLSWKVGAALCGPGRSR